MHKLPPKPAHIVQRIHWPLVIVVVAVLIVAFSGSPYEPFARIAEALTEPAITRTIERIC